MRGKNTVKATTVPFYTSIFEWKIPTSDGICLKQVVAEKLQQYQHFFQIQWC